MCGKWFKNKFFYTALGMSLLPLLAGILLCLADGRSVLHVSLSASVWDNPASSWSDELYYYKQAEAVIHHGFPQGFFGYNESRADYLSFATWSPVVLLPYVIWGLLFGWNLYSPILCNIFLSMLAVFLFVWMTKPDKKQCMMLGVMYVSSLFSARYMLSAMSETSCSFWAILYLGLCINYGKEQKTSKLVFLFLIVGVMTLIRPYYLIFMLLPAYYAFVKFRLPSVFVSIGAVLGFGILYFVISEKFCADYFSNLYHQVWLSNYGISEAGKAVWDTILLLYRNFKDFVKLFINDLKGTENAFGLIGQFTIIVLFLLVQAVEEGISKRKERAWFYGYFGGSFLTILAAFFLLYQMHAGNRHLLVLIVMGIFLLSRMEDKYWIKTGLVTLALLFFFFRVPAGSEQKMLYYRDSAIEAELQAWEEVMQAELVPEKEAVPNWDNVVLWAYSDTESGEADYLITRWQLLYAVPSGLGISCCQQSYILNGFDTLKGKYLAVIPDGQIDELCIRNGKREIGRTQNLVLYELH